MPDYGIFIIAKWLSDKLNNNNTKKDSKEYSLSDISSEYLDKVIANPGLVKQDYIAGKLSLEQYLKILQNGLWMEHYMLGQKLKIDFDNKIITKNEMYEIIGNMHREKIRLFNDNKNISENISEYERVISKYRKMRGES